MIFDIVTIFPDLLDSPLNEGIIRRARQDGQIKINITNIRDFALDKHAMTDDRPFGGGEGMVMKPAPLAAAVDDVKEKHGEGEVILLSPQGEQFNQQLAEDLVEKDHLILVCGRYEGVDERFRSRYVDREISIGDFILTGGELAAMVIVDAATRLVPDVLGCAESASNDTFSSGLLKHPQYTRPRDWNGVQVPETLLSGNHKQIEEYRLITAVERTLSRRPELLTARVFSKSEQKILRKAGLYDKIKIVQEKREP